MPVTSKLTSPSKGMILDLHPDLLQEGMYVYALNATLEQNTEDGFVIQNDSSNFLTATFPEGYIVIGTCHIVEQSRIFFFLVNAAGQSEIGQIIYKNAVFDTRQFSSIKKAFCKDCGMYDLVEPIPLERTHQVSSCTYTTILNTDCLEFSRLHPVDVEYKLSDCAIQLYFVDGYNPDRYIYFDEDETNLTVQSKFLNDSGELDCDKLLIQPKLGRPVISVDDVFSGGNLRMGVYQFFVAYATANGLPVSSYYGVTQPVPIFIKNDTLEPDFKTDQAIKLKIDGLTKTSAFQYYNIVVAETINNFTEYKLAATLPIDQLYYTYSGRDDLPRLTENDVIEKYPYYHHANSITKSNEYLFRANLVENKQLNLQRVANHIELDWQTIALQEGDYKRPEIAQMNRSFMRDEVYPFAIIFEIDGQDTAAFHIPGRSATRYDRELLVNKAVDDTTVTIDCTTVPRLERWQTYNTGTLEAAPHQEYDSCNEAIWEYGKMSYWESTELYPNKPEIWGNLANTPIRHHKFPDSAITHIHSNNRSDITLADLGSNSSFEEILEAIRKLQTVYIYPIGIRVNHASVKKALQQAVTDRILTQKEVNSITGYRIVRGNRANDKSIIAKGLLFDVWNYIKEGTPYYYANYPYNDLRPDPFIARNNFYKSKQIPYKNEFTNDGRYTFHSPDVHFVEPTIGSILKLETEEYGKSTGYFTKALNHAEHRIVTNKAYETASLFGASIANATRINDDTEQQSSNLGSSIGGAIGTIAGGPIGTAIGSVAGALLGGLFANNMFGGFWKDVAQSITKMSLALYNAEKLLTFFRFLIPHTNYNYQYNSTALYTSFKPVLNELGIKQRLLTNYSYLRPEIASISENGKSVFINNFNRESSVYIKIKNTLPPTTTQDTSRFLIGSFVECAQRDEKINRNATVASYYASIKNLRLDQYGSIYTIDYLETNSISYSTTRWIQETKTIFGGDIFINKFAIKRKMPFFTSNTFNLPNDSDFYHSDFANVGFPIYYLNTQGDDDYYLANPLSFFNISTSGLGIPLFSPRRVNVPSMTKELAIARRAKANFDCESSDPSKWIARKGLIYLYSYGIPIFIVESDINLDFRQAQNNLEKDFYPRQSNIDYWLQEKNVSIREDNYYFYNKTFSKQNKESFISINNALFDPSKTCTTTYPNRVIYSQQASVIDSNVSRDSWLIYKANNYYDFSKTNGDLVSVEGIENEKILARFEKTAQIFNAYSTLQADTATIQVDTGGMFKTKPQEYAHTDLGYAGSQHKAILHTEFGHIFVDAERGQVFVLGTNSLDELSKEGVKNWFSKNLPFVLPKQVPDFPLKQQDNSYNGLGIQLYYDRLTKRLFITKLDYKLKGTPVYFDTVIGLYIQENGVKKSVKLADTRYFESVSWTISYNFYTKTWVSFHSFKPNFTISGINLFMTGINNLTSSAHVSSVWSHSVSNRSYQVYYGVKSPFIVETTTKIDGKQHIIQNIEYSANVFNYHKDQTKTELSALPFNKAIVYTNKSNSGLLEKVNLNPKNLQLSLTYPIFTLNSRQIQVTNRENVWRFNQFSNIQKNNVPTWILSADKKQLNPIAVNYLSSKLDNFAIRGEWCRVQLINDDWTNYKIILKWLIAHSIQSIS